MTEFHFDDNILVINNDVLARKSDKVSRIAAKNEDGEFDIIVEVLTEIYPIHRNEKLRMVVCQTLNPDGSAVTSYFSKEKWRSLADKFEYVMHGLVYKMAEDTSATDSAKSDIKVESYISFGGLQLMLRGPPSKMGKFKVDQRLFLLLRKM